MQSLAGTTNETRTASLTLKEIEQLNKEWDELTAQHQGHYPNFIDVCPLCIHRAAYHFNRHDDHEVQARLYLSGISEEVRDAAIEKVNRLFDDENLHVQPIKGAVAA